MPTPLDQRQTESALLKERWSLIQSGVPRAQIRIRIPCIYVNGKLHGRAINSVFQQANTVTLLPSNASVADTLATASL